MIKSKKIRLNSNSQGETCCFITNENIRDVYGITENLLGNEPKKGIAGEKQHSISYFYCFLAKKR